MILADKITELRKRNGWSQEELADKLYPNAIISTQNSYKKYTGTLTIPTEIQTTLIGLGVSRYTLWSGSVISTDRAAYRDFASSCPYLPIPNNGIAICL